MQLLRNFVRTKPSWVMVRTTLRDLASARSPSFHNGYIKSIISQWLYQGCSHCVLWLESVSQKKGTERRDDSGSRRKYATESSRQEKITRPHHHGTSSVYLSPDFSSDLLNRNATGTAILGNNMRENPVDITNITTPCQVNKNCNCCN